MLALSEAIKLASKKLREAMQAEHETPTHEMHLQTKYWDNRRWTARRKARDFRHQQDWKKASRSSGHFWKLFNRRMKGPTSILLREGMKSNAPPARVADATQHGTHYRSLLTVNDKPHFDPKVLADAEAYNVEGNRKVPDDHPLQRPLSLSEVEEAVKLRREKTKSSPGPDDATWAEVCAIPAETLRTPFQECVDKTTLANSWKVAPIIPIDKPTTKPNDPATYRGITLESCFLKMLTTIICRCMEEWAAQEKILPETQGGFLRGQRTEKNLFVLHAAIQRAMVDKTDIVVAFIDLQKAFDTVSRPLLWAKLKRMGAGGSIFLLIQTMYEQLHTLVRVHGEDSPLFKAEIGVLQGDPLSGFLWILFLADLHIPKDLDAPLLSGSRVPHLEFADDIAMLAIQKRSAMQTRFDYLDAFCRTNHLTTSIAKTVVVEVKHSRISVKQKVAELADDTPHLAPEIRITTNGAPLKGDDHAKYLGLCFESTNATSYIQHFITVEKKARAMANCAVALQHCVGVMPVQQAILFYNERILMVLLYASCITFATVVPAYEMLERTFFRRILGVPDTAGISGLYIELGTFPLQMHRLEAAIKFYFYAASTVAPPLLRAALLDNQQLDVMGNSRTPSWFASLVHQCEERGIGTPPHLKPGEYYDFSIASSRSMRTALLKNLRASESKRLLDSVLPSPRFTELRRPGTKHRLQPYLVHNSFPTRNAMTRARLSNHKLGVQTGREHSIAADRQTCRFCTSGAIETVQHAPAQCIGSVNVVILRKTLLLRLAQVENDKRSIPQLHLILQQRDAVKLWDFLLNAENPRVSTIVAGYIECCFREFYTLPPRYLANATKSHASAAAQKLYNEILQDEYCLALGDTL